MVLRRMLLLRALVWKYVGLALWRLLILKKELLKDSALACWLSFRLLSRLTRAPTGSIRPFPGLWR